MRTRSTAPPIGLLAALVLALSAVIPAVAQDESPEPSVLPAIVEQVEERAAETAAAREERRAERATKREERRIDRAAKREELNAKREIAKAERAAKRDERVATREERTATRSEKKAAWAEAKDACKTELAAIRAQEWEDKAARKAAWQEARGACRDALVAAAGPSADDPSVDQFYTDAAAADASGVARTDLGIAEPGSAVGQELGLWHYLIPAGQELVPHTHPGWQLARVTAGELEYTVVEGEGVLLRADGSSEPMGPGTYVLAEGDGVIENPELIHLGANRTAEPVTIISATLFEAGQPIATTVEEEAAGD